MKIFSLKHHRLKCWSTDYNYPFDYCNLKQKDYAHVRSCYESVSYGSSGGVELGVNSNAVKLKI